MREIKIAHFSPSNAAKKAASEKYQKRLFAFGETLRNVQIIFALAPINAAAQVLMPDKENKLLATGVDLNVHDWSQK